MILDLKDIFMNEGACRHLSESIDLGDEELFGNHPFKAPVSIEGKVENRAGVVRLTVACGVSFSAPCDRCGEPTEKLYSVPVDRVLAAELQDEENDDIILIKDMKLDLYELCRSEILLFLPTKHLCRKDCKGVCPFCGADRNKVNCNCSDAPVDPRLGALGELLK